MSNKVYLGVITILLLVIIYMATCGHPKPCPTISIKHDTTYLNKFDSTGWVHPSPIRKVPENGGKPDTLTIYEPIVRSGFSTDSAYKEAVVKDYNSTYLYYDSVYLDSVHKEYGKVYRKDSVSNNRILSYKWYTDIHLPTIHETTQVPIEVKRFQVYVGPSVQGTLQSLLNGVGPTIAIKTKKDKFYSATVLFTSGKPIYQVSGLVKIGRN